MGHGRRRGDLLRVSSGPPPGLDRLEWAPPCNFLGLDAPDATWDRSTAVILPIPYEATTSWGTGTRYGPAAILDASQYVELYDDELDAEPFRHGVCTLPGIELTHEGPEAAVAQLRDLYDSLLGMSGERFVIGLGGEHSISSAPATAWVDRLGDELSILQVDAHSDLRSDYHGTRWSHASVMRRILDRTNNIVAVGIRSLTVEESALIREREIVTVFAEELRRPGWVERAVESLRPNVYITFDVDFFDPSVIPGTGTPEPGGGDWWQALDLLRAVFAQRNVVGADVVELAPSQDDLASPMTTAKLVYKLIGYHTAR